MLFSSFWTALREMWKKNHQARACDVTVPAPFIILIEMIFFVLRCGFLNLDDFTPRMVGWFSRFNRVGRWC